MRIVMIALAAAGVSACDRKPHDSPKVTPAPVVLAYDGAIANDPAALVKHGARLSKVLGCRGCHGDTLQGEKFADQPGFGAIHASNLTLAMQTYDATAIERALREGRRPDGSEL